MITKEEICGYLPYGLKCHCSGLHVDDYDEPVVPITVEIVGMSWPNIEVHEIGRTVTEDYHHEDVFPILRPLSDFTREIKHNGKKFVPIMELAKIGISYKIDNVLFTEIIEDTHALHYESKDEEYVFGFDKDGFYHKCVTPLHVLNQLQLFQKLCEWHFDIYGLIERGDAIDINILTVKEKA